MKRKKMRTPTITPMMNLIIALFPPFHPKLSGFLKFFNPFLSDPRNLNSYPNDELLLKKPGRCDKI
jgi:hypothetical protein